MADEAKTTDTKADSAKARFQAALGMDPAKLSDGDLDRITGLVTEADKLRPLAGAGTTAVYDAHRRGEAPPEQASTVPDD
jgi:hypothetical protein